jgi:outer membrane protein assembly factor BamB/predicted phosphodiesterase
MSKPFSFVQITDIHVGARSPAEWLAEDLKQIEAEVGNRVEFIAATGDLTDHGTAEQCQAYVNATKATRLKIYPVVGNHDYVNGTWENRVHDAGEYQKQISTLNYAFDFEGVHFISYDSIAKGSSERPSEWLLADLAAQPRERPIILLIHYQLPDSFYEPLKPYRIVATLSGHWHTSRLYHDGKIAHFNTPSLCFGGIDYSPRTYRVFSWNGTALRCETVHLKRPQPANPAPAMRDLEVLWSAPLDADTHMAAPAVCNGRVAAGLMNENEMNAGAVACWDAQSGRQLWRTPLASSVKNTPAAYKDTFIATTVTGEVVALNAADGKRRWSYQLGERSERWVFSAPRVHNSRVYVGPGPHFTALDGDSGKPLWVRTDINNSDWISSYVSPAADEKQVYMGFFWGSNGLLSLDADSGKTLWTIENARDTSGSPVLDGNGALYVMRGEYLQKLNTQTGETIWRFHVAEIWNPATPLLANGLVYAASGSGKVFAIDAGSGTEKWSWQCGDDLSQMLAYRRSSRTIVSSPRIAGDCIAIGCNDGRLVGLHAATGQQEWAHDFGKPVTSSPVVDGDRMFLPIRDGRMYALRVPAV